MTTSRELKQKKSRGTQRRAGQGKGGGRPSSITPEKSAKLLVALENGLNLNESLRQAGISDDAYRRKLEKSPKFRGQIEGSKMKLVMLARSKVAMAIHTGDMPTTRWFLERKVPEEFSLKYKDEHPPMPNMTVILPGSKPHPRIEPDKPELHVIIPGGKHPRFTPPED